MFSRLLLIWSSLNLQVTKTCIKSWTSSNFGQIRTLIAELVKNIWKIFQRVIMGKWGLHASLFLGNKDMFKNYKRFDFWHVQTADIGGTKPWKNNCSFIWKLFKFLMTLLAGLFEMKGCWHIGLRWAIVALWATCVIIIFDLIPFILAGNEGMHKISDEFEFSQIGPLTTELAALERLKNFP